MSRITKALDKLRLKCTEAGHQPKGKGVADILDCIAEHFEGGGSGLPEVTEEDNGAVLTVVDGEWVKKKKITLYIKPFKTGEDPDEGDIYEHFICTSADGTEAISNDDWDNIVDNYGLNDFNIKFWRSKYSTKFEDCPNVVFYTWKCDNDDDEVYAGRICFLFLRAEYDEFKSNCVVAFTKDGSH